MPTPKIRAGPRPVLLVVEGAHDAVFLKTLTQLLHAANPNLLDLTQAETAGRLLCLPAGGSNLHHWAPKLSQLRSPQFHLYDREMQPETGLRQKLVNQLNRQAKCFATLTSRRGLENYLHPTAILNGGGPVVAFSEQDSVAEQTAQAFYEQTTHNTPWAELPARYRRRIRERTKQWLNRHAVRYMTAELLKGSDPAGELLGWLQKLKHLLTKHSKN